MQYSGPGAPAADVINVLYAVTAAGPSDVWAVGESYELNPEHTLIEHWDGSSWSVVSTDPMPDSNEWYGAAAVSSTEWGVGSTSRSTI